MSETEDPRELNDDVLYRAYQDAKDGGSQPRLDELQLEMARRWEASHTDTPDAIDVSQSGRYWNVFLDDEMVASYDSGRGEFAVYDPHSDSEDPAFVVRGGDDDE